MSYNEKRQNNSLERIIWNHYILSQDYSISKTLISKLWMLLIEIHTRKSSLNWTTTHHLVLIAKIKWRNMTSKIPYLETTGMPTRILLRKRRFKCYQCSKIAVAETSLVKKNHQIATIVNQKITQKLIEKVLMTAIAESLSVSTSTVIRKLKEFKFKTDLSFLPTHMSWDEYSFKKWFS